MDCIFHIMHPLQLVPAASLDRHLSLPGTPGQDKIPSVSETADCIVRGTHRHSHCTATEEKCGEGPGPALTNRISHRCQVRHLPVFCRPWPIEQVCRKMLEDDLLGITDEKLTLVKWASRLKSLKDAHWGTIQAFLASGWQEKAIELGALRR